MSDQQQQYLARVLAVLQNNPTAADIDFLVEAYATVGYLAAEAEGLAEDAENGRKYAEATEYLRIKAEAAEAGQKVTEREAEARALVAIGAEREAEAIARTKARKLRNLLESIEQAINAVKYLGRQAG